MGNERQTLGLAGRLILVGALAALLVTGIGGWLLRQQLQDTLRHSFAQRLHSQAEYLTGNLERLPDSEQLRWRGRQSDEFSRIFSGWYWQVDYQGETLSSRSLWDSQLATADAPLEDPAHGLYRLSDARQRPLLGIARDIDIDGVPGRLHIYGPAAEADSELARLERILWLTQALLLFLLTGVGVVQVRFGLAPLRRLRQRLAAVHAGSETTIGQHYGPDLNPLAGELDQILASNAKIVNRARSRAADLSHALKKPLAVLGGDPLIQQQAELHEQIASMSRLIDRHLARASIGAGSIATIALQPPIEALFALMQRLHGERQLAWQVELPADLRWRGEPTDFEEMLGNLLDNAGKWAKQRVRLTARIAPDSVSLLIDDDGPGLSPEQIRQSATRGQRFDERVEGSGLGLVIARDIAVSYGGDLTLGPSPLGGLRVTLQLPR